MKKQILIGMIVLTLGTSLIGCGKRNEKVLSDTTTAVDESQKVNASTETKKGNSKTDTSGWIICSVDPKADIYYPKYYSKRNNAATFLCKENSPYQIIICTDGGNKDKLSENNFNDVFDYLLKRLGESYFLDLMSVNLLGGVKTNCLTKENCKINGYDAFRFTAKTTESKINKESYVYGYFSSTQETNFAIYGVITDESQVDSDTVKKEIQTEVDAIMNTIQIE